MTEQIAVLDGLGSYMSPAYGQDYSEFSRAREVTPVPGGGQNRTGGSDWFSRAPYRLQQEGLAGIGALSMEAYAGSEFTPEPSSGANYQGGSSWHAFAPTSPSSEGLAGSLSIDRVPGYAGSADVPVPGNGQNYTGGSDWVPGFPTSVSSKGLVGLGRLAGPGLVDVWVRCAAVFAMRSLGAVRPTVSARLVSDVLQMQVPRHLRATRESVVFLTAAYVVSRAGRGPAYAAAIGKRAIAHCA